MILLPTLEFRRRDFILNALGTAALLAAPGLVVAQDAGGKSAVIDVSNARNAPIPIAVTDLPLVPRGRVAGPAVVAEPDCTVWVPEGWRAEPGALGAWIIERT